MLADDYYVWIGFEDRYKIVFMICNFNKLSVGSGGESLSMSEGFWLMAVQSEVVVHVRELDQYKANFHIW